MHFSKFVTLYNFLLQFSVARSYDRKREPGGLKNQDPTSGYKIMVNSVETESVYNGVLLLMRKNFILPTTVGIAYNFTC